MDPLETIHHLGACQGSRLKIAYTQDRINKRLPFFNINKERIDIGNFQEHDNADRLPFFASYLGRILSSIEPGTMDVLNGGFFNIELHDTYVYLDKNDDYDNVLVWSKGKKDQNVVLLPDLYNIVNYNNSLERNVDRLNWDDKKNKMAFFGTTTGNMNPAKNERILTCMWGKEHRDLADFYITKVAQMKMNDILAVFPTFRDIVYPQVTPEYMFQYKFLVDIPGNTCSWDRVPLVMNSRSLLFKMPCGDMCWYYPLLHDREHYIHVDVDDIVKKHNYYLNNPKEAAEIIKRANAFVKTYLHPDSARIYTKALFEAAAEWGGR